MGELNLVSSTNPIEVQQLHTAETFEITFEQAAVGLAHVAPDGSFLQVNQKLCEIFGYTHHDFLNKSFHEITHPDDLKNDLHFFQQMLQAEIRTYSIEKRCLHRNGSFVWVNTSVSLVLESNLKPRYFIFVIEDISDRKQAEATLQRYSQRVIGLHKIDRAILAEKQPQEIACAGLHYLRQLVCCQQAAVILFDIQADSAQILAIDASDSLIFSEGAQLPLKSVINPANLHVNTVRHISNLAALAKPCQFYQQVLSANIHAFLAIPLFVEGKAIGELWLLDPHAAAFNSEHIDIACEVADHLAIALQNVKLFEQVRSDRERLQSLSSRLIEAQELERRHLAHELHDEIGQVLTAVKINLQVLQRSLTSSGSKYPIQDSVTIVDGALKQVRNLALDLRPSMLDDLGLLPALEWYLNQQMQRTKLSISLLYDPFESALSPKLETVCYRIVQEALTNIVRYAEATHVVVCLKQSDNTLHLSVQDDGIGFDVRAARDRASRGSSLGLPGMEERTALVGGQLRITSVLEQGTVIEAAFPIDFPLFNV